MDLREAEKILGADAVAAIEYVITDAYVDAGNEPACSLAREAIGVVLVSQLAIVICASLGQPAASNRAIASARQLWSTVQNLSDGLLHDHPPIRLHLVRSAASSSD